MIHSQIDTRAMNLAWRRHLKEKIGADCGIRIGLTSSFTIEPLEPYLGATLLEQGVSAPDFRIADYNQVAQSCLSPETAFGPDPLDAIVIAWRVEDLSPSGDPFSCEDAGELLINAVGSLSDRFAGTIIVSLPPRPEPSNDTLVRFSKPDPLVQVWHRLTTRLIEVIGVQERVHVVDLDQIKSTLGDGVVDARKLLMYRQPFSEAFFAQFGVAAARILRARSLEAKKCLVLDCDNTLWGGVIGEDGIGGIQISDDFPGLAFRRFQQQIKALSESGIFIALCSKNNPNDAWEVFDSHDGMVIKRDDVSAAEINWQPKSENLKAIAKTLNIGTNALVFVDDSSFEISEVSTHAPEVTCLQVPEDLSELPGLLPAHAHLFDRLIVTEDDTARVRRMKGEANRQSLSQKLTEEDFLAQLELKVFVYPPEASDLARVTQLINKTNQFNCLTRRFSLEDVEQYLAGSDNQIFCMTVTDKFGEYGLVGVAMVSRSGEVAQFDNLLMSCRVLGRGVETTLLSAISRQLADQGIQTLIGEHIPTAKNKMVADLYSRHGFELVVESSDGTSRWQTELPNELVAPEFVTLQTQRPV